MLGSLTTSLFSNFSEVYEVSPQRFVMSIFKNGRSSLLYSGFRLVDPSEYSAIKTIEIFYRDPLDRMVAGVGKFILDLVVSDITLDINTCNYFATEYLSLNKHYCPQFFWILNFRRWSDALITIKPLSELRVITSRKIKPARFDFPGIKERLLANPEIENYLGYDYALRDLVGQTVSVNEIVSHIKNTYPETYKIMNLAAEVSTLCIARD